MRFRYQKFPAHGSNPRDPFIARPYVPVFLHGAVASTKSPYYALLDSGADAILLPADLANEVGISDIKKGKGPQATIGIAGQRTDIYYFDLALQILGDVHKLPCEIGFSEKIFIPILGRSFFRHFKSVIFNETKEEVEFKV